MTTSRRALGCSDARRAGRTAGRSLSVGTFPTLRPFGHQQPREDAASVRRGAVTSDRSVRPPPLAACWRVPLPTCHDSASRRRWWPRGSARMRPGLSHQPPHRCRHGSGARETGHRPYHDPRPRRNGAATTGTLTYSRRVSAMHARRPTSNRHPSFRAGRRDPWRRRWGGWKQHKNAPVVVAHREGTTDGGGLRGFYSIRERREASGDAS